MMRPWRCSCGLRIYPMLDPNEHRRTGEHDRRTREKVKREMEREAQTP